MNLCEIDKHVTVVISECIANCIDCQSSGAANCASTGCVGARYYTTTPSPSCASKSFKSVLFVTTPPHPGLDERVSLGIRLRGKIKA